MEARTLTRGEAREARDTAEYEISELRQRAIALMGQLDGIATLTHVALGSVVSALDDAGVALDDDQLGDDTDEPRSEGYDR